MLKLQKHKKLGLCSSFSVVSMFEAAELEAEDVGPLTAWQCRRSFNNLPRNGPILRVKNDKGFVMFVCLKHGIVLSYNLYSNLTNLTCPRHKCQPTVNAAISRTICTANNVTLKRRRVDPPLGHFPTTPCDRHLLPEPVAH